MFILALVRHTTITCCIPQSDLKRGYGDQPAKLKRIQVSRVVCRPGVRRLQRESPPRTVLKQARSRGHVRARQQLWAHPGADLPPCGAQDAKGDQVRCALRDWGQGRVMFWEAESSRSLSKNDKQAFHDPMLPLKKPKITQTQVYGENVDHF